MKKCKITFPKGLKKFSYLVAVGLVSICFWELGHKYFVDAHDSCHVEHTHK